MLWWPKKENKGDEEENKTYVVNNQVMDWDEVSGELPCINQEKVTVKGKHAVRLRQHDKVQQEFCEDMDSLIGKFRKVITILKNNREKCCENTTE